MSNSALNLVSLDFDSGKQSFITWMQGQDRFKDYDFNGADVNILLDILQVNTFRNAFYLNMAISEGFIDSAQLPVNIKSHAKELNYCPASATSAYANVIVSFQANGTGPYVIQKGQTFSCPYKNVNYVFSVPENIICASTNSSFSFTTNIYEGSYFKDSYIYNNQTPGINSFLITNENADTSSLVVNVFEGSNTIGQNFAFAPSLLGLNSNSQVYFLQTSALDGRYEVLLGDNIIGAEPQNGSLIVLDYRISSGSRPNGAGYFVINFDPTLSSAGVSELTSPVSVQVVDNAQGGANIEPIEVTRFNAPRWFQAQERAIVPADYEILLTKQFAEISAINAYGGENLTPQQYGKVVIAVVLNGIAGLPNSLVTKYTNYIQNKMGLTLIPIFVQPTFVYIQINTIIRYNTNLTTASIPTIESEVLSTITNFANNNLNDFDVSFNYSPFTTAIDQSDPSIIGDETTIQLYQKINPTPGSNNNFFLDYEVPLFDKLSPITSNTYPTTLETVLTSSVFTNNGAISYLADDNDGNINIVTSNGASFNVVAQVGSINYANGTVQINNFNPDSYSGNALLVYVTPATNDVTVTQGTFLSIEPTEVNINVVPVSINQ